MRAAIIYESLTGNTKQAAWYMGDAFYRHGVATRLFPASGIDPEVVAASDIVIVGSWTDGFFVVGQRVGRGKRIRVGLPELAGKPCFVYCTYAVNSGKVLQKLQKTVERAGGQVLGGKAIRRDALTKGADDFVEQVMAVAARHGLRPTTGPATGTTASTTF